MHRRAAVVAVASLMAAAAPAFAAPSPGPRGVSVVPTGDSPHRSSSGAFAELGQVTAARPVVDAVNLISGDDVPQTVLLYGADAIPSRGGGFAFKARTDRQTQLGSWLTVATQRVTVPPRATVRVRYVVTVPRGTDGGEYVGGLIAEPVDTAPTPGVTTVTRFAMAVYLRVPGGAPGATPGRGRPGGKLVVTKLQPRFRGGLACPVVSYRNDSQDVLDPQARVSTRGPFGGSSYERRRTGAVLPGTSADVQLPCLKRPLGPGRLEVRLTTPREQINQVVHGTWLPFALWFSLLLLLLLIGALITTFLRGSRRRRREEGAERQVA